MIASAPKVLKKLVEGSKSVVKLVTAKYKILLDCAEQPQDKQGTSGLESLGYVIL